MILFQPCGEHLWDLCPFGLSAPYNQPVEPQNTILCLLALLNYRHPGPMLAAGPVTSSSLLPISAEETFIALSLIGFIISILIAAFVENNAIKKGGFIILNRPKNHTQDILTVLKSRQPWLIAAFSALIYFALEYFSENEGRMLLATKGIDIIDASYIISISWLGYAIGNPLLGALSDVTEKRTSFMKLCALTTIIAFLIKTFVNINLKLASLGVAASGQTISAVWQNSLSLPAPLVMALIIQPFLFSLYFHLYRWSARYHNGQHDANVISILYSYFLS